MKKIIDNKIYDTDTAEKIIDYKEKILCKGLLTFYTIYNATLYKTKKGAYFKYIKEPVDTGWPDNERDLVIMSDDEVKYLLSEELNEPDVYQELFGKVDEG